MRPFSHSLAFAPATASAATDPALGDLPVWKLEDLYPAPNSDAFRNDMEKALADAKAFEAKWKGGLEAAAGQTGPRGIGAALAEYEALDDLLGKLGSYAGLTYFSDTLDPANGKFFGDAQQKLTALSSHLLFFALELNRIDDAVMDACMLADSTAGHYRPWLVDLRLDKPYQLDDKLEELFHDKSTTAFSAWNRLFDETLSS